MVTADWCSRYIWVDLLKSLDTKAITKTFSKITRIFGIPLSCGMDRGPQFRGPFDAYCASQGIRHETSSPYHPQSNDHAEATVKSAKHLMQKSGTAFPEALATWQNTARSDRPSPNEMLFGRKIRDIKATAMSNISTLPVPITNTDVVTPQQIPEENTALTLTRGGSVHVQDHLTERWDIPAMVTEISHTGRTCDMITDEGDLIRRNRRFIRRWCAAWHKSSRWCAQFSLSFTPCTSLGRNSYNFLHDLKSKISSVWGQATAPRWNRQRKSSLKITGTSSNYGSIIWQWGAPWFWLSGWQSYLTGLAAGDAGTTIDNTFPSHGRTRCNTPWGMNPPPTWHPQPMYIPAPAMPQPNWIQMELLRNSLHHSADFSHAPPLRPYNDNFSQSCSRACHQTRCRPDQQDHHSLPRPMQQGRKHRLPSRFRGPLFKFPFSNCHIRYSRILLSLRLGGDVLCTYLDIYIMS